MLPGCFNARADRPRAERSGEGKIQSSFRNPLTMPTFYDSFLECAKRRPKDTALEIQHQGSLEKYTYGDTRRMAEGVGNWLSQNGYGEGARIIILADNHPRWVAAYLGIIAAGCVVVPLDTAFRPDQV